MADITIGLSDVVDLNVRIDANAVNAGVTYDMSSLFQELADLTSDGILTPKAAGLLLVNATDVNGNPLKQFIVIIESDAQNRFDQQISSGGVILSTSSVNTFGANDSTPPAMAGLTASWEADVLTIGWGIPTDPESGITSILLDVRSSDESEILSDNVSVLGITVAVYALLKDGLTYDISLTAINSNALSS